MPLKSKRPVSGASRARMQKVAEHRIKKQMQGKGIGSALAKMLGPIILKEAVSIGSALVKKKIAGKPKKKKKKKGGALRPAGARAPARRRTAPIPRVLPHKVGKGKKKKSGRKKY